MPTMSMFDRKLFELECRHHVVLGRLSRRDTWKCDEMVDGNICGHVTDLRVEPYSSRLVDDWDLADQVDKQARERGETVVRADQQ
jgi:hypothetical protein